MAISEFRGDYRFLSNFWYAEVMLDGMKFPSVEHAFQAAKTLDVKARVKFQTGTPTDAKRLGRTVKLREGWDSMKLAVMENLLRQKFSGGELKEMLLNTGSQPLVEGNHWNDFFWGVCRGKGENHLGRLLMRIRAELQNK